MYYLNKVNEKKFSLKREQFKKEIKCPKRTKRQKKWNYQDMREWYSQPEIDVIEDIDLCLYFSGAKIMTLEN